MLQDCEFWVWENCTSNIREWIRVNQQGGGEYEGQSELENRSDLVEGGREVRLRQDTQWVRYLRVNTKLPAKRIIIA